MQITIRFLFAAALLAAILAWWLQFERDSWAGTYSVFSRRAGVYAEHESISTIEIKKNGDSYSFKKYKNSREYQLKELNGRLVRIEDEEYPPMLVRQTSELKSPIELRYSFETLFLIRVGQQLPLDWKVGGVKDTIVK